MKNNKLKVEVFVPFGVCACSFGPLMRKVAEVTSNFKELVEVQMRSTTSKEAILYSIDDSCVIVGGTVKLRPNFEAKELEEAITQKVKNV